MPCELGMWPGATKLYASGADRDAAYDAWVREEAERVIRQRAFLEKHRCMPTSIAPLDELIAALLARAEELLDMGHAGAADQLLEFVPEADADAFNARYFGEQEAPKETTHG